MRSRILFISGHRQDARSLTTMLGEMPVDVDYATSLRAARTKLQRSAYTAILTEAEVQDGNWLDVLNLSRAASNEPKVIVTDRQADARFWSQALNLGAFDLLPQPFYQPEVRRILNNVCTRPALANAAV